MRIFSYYTFAILFVGLFLSSINAQTFYGTTDLKTFRDGRDEEFRNEKKSPLLTEDFAKFEGLNYFPTDNKYRITAKMTKTTDEKYFLMPTSSGSAKKYIKYAVLEFKIDETDYVLNVYQADEATRKAYPEYANLLFIPFKDLSNGVESYVGGRYLYIWETDKTEVILDFNLASNPSCAYGNDKYSCPIPPRDNHLKVEIKAGEKKYNYSKTDK